MTKKIMIANGKYTTQDGTEKTTWKEVGVIMTSQNGKEFCLLDPTVNLGGFTREPGKDKIIASIFEDKPKEQQNQGYVQQQPPAQNQGYSQPQQSQQQQYTANGAPIIQYDVNGNPI